MSTAVSEIMLIWGDNSDFTVYDAIGTPVMKTGIFINVEISCHIMQSRTEVFN